MGQLDQLVVGAVIGLADDAYGISVWNRINKVSERQYTFAAVYTALARLEHEGYLRSAKGAPTAERGGRAKRFYSVTAPGKRALDGATRSVQAVLRPRLA